MGLSTSFNLKPCLLWQICLKINFSSGSWILVASIYFFKQFYCTESWLWFRWTHLVAFSVYIIFAFFNKNRHNEWVSFKIIFEHFKLMISKNLSLEHVT